MYEIRTHIQKSKEVKVEILGALNNNLDPSKYVTQGLSLSPLKPIEGGFSASVTCYLELHNAIYFHCLCNFLSSKDTNVL